jgi:hypothetical protein
MLRQKSPNLELPRLKECSGGSRDLKRYTSNLLNCCYTNDESRAPQDLNTERIFPAAAGRSPGSLPVDICRIDLPKHNSISRIPSALKLLTAALAQVGVSVVVDLISSPPAGGASEKLRVTNGCSIRTLMELVASREKAT